MTTSRTLTRKQEASSSAPATAGGKSKSLVEFAFEKISPALADGLEDLIAFNWDEVSASYALAPPLDIDWPRYLMLERMGQYRSISARKNGRLVGYNAYFIEKPLRHRRMTWAVNDALFLDRVERKGMLGWRLLKESIRLLREILPPGSFVLHGDMLGAISTTAKAHATFGDLLLREGFIRLESVYVCKL